MNANDIELALRARAVFNDSVERIDADTRRRLREARLHVRHPEPRGTPVRWAWPAGAALAAALALAVFVPRLPYTHMTAAQPSMPMVATATHPAATSILADRSDPTTATHAAAPDALETADPELLSDLDFYGWLANQPNHRASGG